MQNLKKYTFLLIFFLSLVSCNEELAVDILIVNGNVYNGIDYEASKSAIGIKDNKIIYVGSENSKKIKAIRTIDATGLVVSPGFIDPHTHADRDLKEPTSSHNKPFLFQGVTTVVVGNDGDSFYPFSEYKEKYESHGIGTNVAVLAGHGTIRNIVMGKSDRKATLEEIESMKELLKQEMISGAFGMSTGLFYAPGSYSDTEEVIALAETVADFQGIYDSHLRDESSYTVGLIPAIEEAIEIGKQAKLPIHISHIKCLGVDVWKQSDSIIGIIEKARLAGVKVTANQYPYDASATGLKAAVVPRWAESGGKDSLFIRYENTTYKQRILEETNKNIIRRGGPDKLLIVKAVDTSFVGKNLFEISKMLNLTSEEAVFAILKTGYVRIASFNMNPYDIHNFMKQDWVVTGSDGNTGHPRKYGSFPRKYNKYVKNDTILELASFINGSTSTTADIFDIPKRGKIKVGYYADVIIFDPNTFKDKANYSDAFQLAEGLEHSIINGKLSVSNGVFTDQLNGKVLKK